MLMWTLTDLANATTYALPINPSTMDRPFNPKNLTTLPGAGCARTVKATPIPQEWSFGGKCRGKPMHDALLDWATRGHEIQVADHLGRTFRILPTRIEFRELRSRREPWRFTYTMRGLLTRQVGGGIG
jgi:hypothetical protein